MTAGAAGTGRTPNPPAFVEAIHQHLAGKEQQFNYQAMLHTFLDNDRFHRWAALIDRHHPLEGASFLSSGCGMGGSLLAYHDAGVASVTGVEVDPEFAHLSRLRVADLPTAAVHLLPPSAPLPLDPGSVDVIESMDVIEHVPDPRAYLSDLVRVLAPDGLILVVTPNRLWPVEQHLGIVGPPWLPVGPADRLFTGLSRLPVGEDRRFRYAKLAGMRTQNMSLRRLRNLATALDLHLSLLVRDEDDTEFPLPADHPRAEALLAHRVGKFAAPVKTLAVTLQRRPARRRAPRRPAGGG